MSEHVCVVGRGLVGSAAARHLVEGGNQVTLIGPPEPADRKAWNGPFSSHPDEGRITRLAGRTLPWSILAARSVARYADIEQRSGVGFYTVRGLAAALPEAEDWVRHGQAVGSDARLVDPDWLYDTTGIRVSNGHPIAYESAPAGHINPRRLVQAQCTLVAAGGGTVIGETVTSLRRIAEGRFELGGAFGTLSCDKVLLATGAFGGELLSTDLALHRFPRTVLMAEMGDDGRIPSAVVSQPADDRINGIYWVPPVRYPDGRLCLKIGGDLEEIAPVAQEDLTEWFHQDGSAMEAEALENCLRDLLPDVTIASVWRTPCVTTLTDSTHPFIGHVEPGLAVAIGGNGSAAKSSDEIGRLGAELLAHGSWVDTELDQALFEPAFD